MKKQGHWVLKERSTDQMQSMPPIMPNGTLKDSGIGEEQEIFTRSGAARYKNIRSGRESLKSFGLVHFLNIF